MQHGFRPPTGRHKIMSQPCLGPSSRRLTCWCCTRRRAAVGRGSAVDARPRTSP
nr:MAG TPA: hypothetical protein [Caudoviricetes sp.]